jgi:hypothetical protein
LAQLREEGKGASGFLFVDPLQREPDVDEDIFSRLDPTHVIEAHLLGRTAKIDASDEHPFLFDNLDDPSWNRKAHSHLVASGDDRELAER